LAKEQGGTLTAEEKHKHFSHLIENVLTNKDYQYAFLRYLKNYNIQDFNFQQDIKSELHLKLESNSASPLTLFLSTLIEKNLDNEQEYTPKFLFEEYCAFLKEAKFHFEDNIKTFLFNLTELYKIKYAKKYEKTSLKLLINRKELKEILIVKFKVNFDQIDGGVANIVEEDREKIINKALAYENNELKKQIAELTLLLSKKQEPELAVVIEPIIDDDISVLTESTTQSKKKIIKVLKFKPEALNGLTDKEIIEFLSVEKVNKFSKDSQQKACDIVKQCELRIKQQTKRVKEEPKREYSWKDIEDCVTNQEKLDYFEDTYNEYTEESKIKIDEEIVLLTAKVNKIKAHERGETVIEVEVEVDNISCSGMSVQSSLVSNKSEKKTAHIDKKFKKFKSRAQGDEQVIDLNSIEL
jgi:hypothetical protein